MEYVRGLIVHDTVEVHEWFQRCLRDAATALEEAKKGPLEAVARALVDDLTIAYNQFNVDMKELSARAAATATKAMTEKLQAKERPSAGNSPPAAELAKARALETGTGAAEMGWVGVGDVTMLNRMVNVHTPGYKSYWRALEYGTGNDGVPSQTGRVLFGAFTTAGGGSPTPPASQYAGGGGPHPVFMSKSRMASPDHSAIGFGTIGKEDAPKHFIEYAMTLAGVEWREAIAKAQERAIKTLDDIKL
jgi:hypothetical protein